jgi:glucosyl-3-phosphoglycerate synthase
MENFRSLKATYYRIALDFVEIYKKDCDMNSINLDIHKEEKAVELFAENIMTAGETFLEKPLETPFIPTWNRVESAKPGFMKRLKTAVESYN